MSTSLHVAFFGLLVLIAACFAQYPTRLSCVPVTPSANAYCFGANNSTTSIITYPVVNGTDVNAGDQMAQTNANNAYTQAPNKNATCQEALRAYYCELRIPKCSYYAPVTAICSQRCAAVRTACGFTEFPGTLPGTQCTASGNTPSCIDNFQPLCAPRSNAAVGQYCSAGVNPSYTGNQNVTSVCVGGATCNSANQPFPVCQAPSNLGDFCNATAPCVNYPNTLAGVAPLLTCIGNKCALNGKRNGYSCSVNEECFSGSCRNGTCFETPLRATCTNNNECGFNKYCANTTCTDNANLREACGQLVAGAAPVPCKSGFSCVRSTSVNGTSAFCVANAEIGQSCDVVQSVVQNHPLCGPATLSAANYGAACHNGTCVALSGQGVACGTGLQGCALNLACDANSKTCQPATSVACNTAGLNTCNQGQFCNCGSMTADGTCQIEPASTWTGCSQQLFDYQNCVRTQCNGAPFYPYDNSQCDTTCRTSLNAIVCCAQRTVGANSFIAPRGFNVAFCATPTPAPTQPTASPTPKVSGASIVAVEMLVVVLAVVAMLF